MATPDPETLRSAFSAASSWNEWATVLVVLGVVMDLLALLIFNKEMSRREKRFLGAASVLIVVGVGGEYVFGGREAAAAVQLQQLSDQTVAGLQREQEADHKIAAQAAAHAADLGVTVDKLRGFVAQKESEASAAAQAAANDAAKVTTALNAERDVRQQFAQMVEPRQLAQGDTASVVAALRQFAGQEFRITTFWELKEPLAFANQLYSALLSGGWKYNKPDNGQFLLGGLAGVQVYVHPHASTKTKSAAQALVAALRGFDAHLRELNDSDPTTELIQLNVGTKY